MKDWNVDDWAFFSMTAGVLIVLPVIGVICFTAYKIAGLFA